MKLSESSKPVMLVKKKLRNEDIFFSNNEIFIWKSDLIFMAYKLNNFCTKFNKLKAEAGCD